MPRYEKTIQARSEAGKKSARKRSTNSTNVNFVEQKATNSTDTDTDTESDIDTGSVLKESDREKAHSPTQKYGENGNVMLTNDEYERLAEQMGVSKRDEYIDKLGDYMRTFSKKSKKAANTRLTASDAGIFSKNILLQRGLKVNDEQRRFSFAYTARAHGIHSGTVGELPQGAFYACRSAL